MTENTLPSVEDRVNAGVEWLVENGPVEWWNLVDYDTLDIDDGKACVLGQVFAAEADITGHFNGWEWFIMRPEATARETVFKGFTPHFIHPRDAELLRDEWINRIEKIRAEVSA